MPDLLTPEEENFINIVEQSKDWWIPLPEEDYKRYEELIAKREDLCK